MKKLFSTYLSFSILVIIVLSSCEKNEISRISFNRDTFALHVGLSDTLISTLNFTGSVSDFPVVWEVKDPTVISIKEEASTETDNPSGKAGSFTKKLVITALKAGNTTLTIRSGSKHHDCQVTVDQQVFNMTGAYASNWGDYFDTGTNNFDMYLLEHTLALNDSGTVQGNGSLLYLDFYLPLAQNNLSSAEFTLSDKGEKNTFFPGKEYEKEGKRYITGTRLITVKNEEASIFLIKDGSFTITKAGNQFEIRGEFILEDNEVIVFNYSGLINEQDKREKPVEINPVFTKGLLAYYGDAYESNATHNFVVYLGSESIDFSAEKWDGDVLMLEFNTDISVTDHIPNGTYRMMKELTYAELKPFSLVFGYVNKEDKEWGTWYYGKSGEQTKKIKTGSMDVTKSGDSYTIGYELYDRFGSKVWGTYTGSLSYLDQTKGNEAASAPAKIKSISAVKRDLHAVRKRMFEKEMMFKHRLDF